DGKRIMTILETGNRKFMDIFIIFIKHRRMALRNLPIEFDMFEQTYYQISNRQKLGYVCNTDEDCKTTYSLFKLSA
ncbi:hypothetical protein HAX54_026029, partial [Datura stramonium]|nr:hypothetical protein [Datura stramonium]